MKEDKQTLTSSVAELYHGQVHVLRDALVAADKRADETELKLKEAHSHQQVIL